MNNRRKNPFRNTMKMSDFPSCFGDNRMHVAECSSAPIRSTQNMVSSIYEIKLAGVPRQATITWVKNFMGPGLSVYIDDRCCQCVCEVDMKSWFFRKKKGCKSFQVQDSKVDVWWDLSSAKFGSGPEPLEGFFVAVVSDHEFVLLVGDMYREAYRSTAARPISTETVLISRREHICGQRLYSTKAQFGDIGRLHDVEIEYQSDAYKDPCLCVRIDQQMVVQVKRLMWNFRGNQTVFVDGLPVELFWDVHNWLFFHNPSNSRAVFMFQTGLSSDKSWSRVAPGTSLVHLEHANVPKYFQGPCFSLLLFAWKSE